MASGLVPDIKDSDSNTSQEGKESPSKTRRSNRVLTTSEQKREEYEGLKKTAFVSSVKGFPSLEEEGKEDDLRSFTLTVTVKDKSKMLALEILIDKAYPEVPVQVQIKDAIGVSHSLIDAIEATIKFLE